MKDKEHNEIALESKPNGHILTWGQSGRGKTYFLCRRVEELSRMGKNILILDYSGSFTKKELEEKKFLYLDKVNRINAKSQNICWEMQGNDDKKVAADIADAFLEILNCESYFQRKLLHGCISELWKTGNCISIPKLMEELENIMEHEKMDETVTSNIDNLGRLLMRLGPYEDMSGFFIKKRTCQEEKGQITIIDLTPFPENQRRFLTAMIMSLFWRDIYCQEGENVSDVIVLDEFQFLSVKDGSTLSGMLREGRKRGLEIILSTQFISHYGKAEVQTLQQVGNMLIFKPTQADLKSSAKIIDPNNWKSWEKVLEHLQVGEAVLKGIYCFKEKNRKSILQTPIVVKM